MYAIAFDMVITDLRANYGEPYNNCLLYTSPSPRDA